MFDRHFLGDAALALALALPIVALTRPDPVAAMQQQASASAQVRHGNVTESDRPISLLR